MSKKKSLGSSPIEFKSQKSTMRFIPDLGVSKVKTKSPKEENTILKTNKQNSENDSNSTSSSSSSSTESNKKIVSYYLKIDLIDQVKSIADQKNMYYSSLVSIALEQWLSAHN